MQTMNNEIYWERGDFIKLIDSLSKEDSKKRHEIRYALFRVKNQLSGGETAEKFHHVIVDHIKKLNGVGTVKSFAEVWDISKVSPKIVIVKRLWSIYQEHDQLIKKVAVTLEKSDTPEMIAKKIVVMEKKMTRKKKVKKI